MWSPPARPHCQSDRFRLGAYFGGGKCYTRTERSANEVGNGLGTEVLSLIASTISPVISFNACRGQPILCPQLSDVWAFVELNKKCIQYSNCLRTELTLNSSYPLILDKKRNCMHLKHYSFFKDRTFYSVFTSKA